MKLNRKTVNFSLLCNADFHFALLPHSRWTSKTNPIVSILCISHLLEAKLGIEMYIIILYKITLRTK